MQKKLVISAFICLLFCKYAMSQNQIDCIYAKNRNIYRGNIIHKTLDSVQILTLAKNLMVFSNLEIDSIVKGNKREEIRNYKNLTGNNLGWFNLYEAALGGGPDDGIGMGFGYNRGYKFKSGFNFSAGASFMYLEADGYYYNNHYRLSATCRYDFPAKCNYPFLSFEGGLQRIFSDPKLVRAPYWHGAVGYCFKKRNGKAILLSAGLTQNMRRYKAFDTDMFYSKGQVYYSDWYYIYDFVLKIGFKI